MITIYSRQKFAILIVIFATIVTYLVKFPYFKIAFYIAYLTITIVFEPLLYRRLKYNRILHRVLFYFPLYFPIFWGDLFLSVNKDASHIYLLLIIFFLIVVWWVVNIKKIIVTKNSILSKFKVPMLKNLYDSMWVLIPIVGEEAFFRGMVLPIIFFLSKNEAVAILVSSIIFVYLHYVNRWSESLFNSMSYIGQLSLSILLSALIFAGGNIFECIVIHFLYNLQLWLPILMRIINSCRRKVR